MAILWLVLGGLKINGWYVEASKPIVIEQPQRVEEIKKKFEPDFILEKHWTEERIKEEIRNTFPERPNTFVRIAGCESSGDPEHIDSSKRAFNPTNGSNDTGIFQLSQLYHGKRMKELHLDPWDVEDNIKFARMLYEENGLDPWTASKPCWSK